MIRLLLIVGLIGIAKAYIVINDYDPEDYAEVS